MILEFSVKNFLSFKEKVTFSMIANSNKELNDNYVEIGGNKVLKSAAIYGANASGKSNLFKILTLVVLMLRSSNSVDINAKLPLIPFKLDKGSVNKPSEFEIKFILDETRYVYGFIADKDKIYDEYLYYYPNGRETKIFDRTNINEYSYTQKDEKILREIEAKNAQNKFFLATATNWNFDKTKAAYNFLTNGIGTCNNLEILKNMAYKMYETNPDYLKDFAIDFLQKADFNIEDYQISQIDVPGEFLTAIPEFITKTLPDKPKAYQVLFKHKNSDNYLSIDEESLEETENTDKLLLEYVNQYGLLGFIHDFPVNRYYTLDKEILLKEFNYINNKDYFTTIKLIEYFKIFFPTTTDKEIEELIEKINKFIYEHSMEKFISPEINNLLYQNEKYYEQVEMIIKYAQFMYNTLKELSKANDEYIDVSEINKLESNHIRVNLEYDGLTIHIRSLKEYIDEDFKLYAIQEKKYLKFCKHCGKAFIANNPKALYDTFSCKNQENVYNSRARLSSNVIKTKDGLTVKVTPSEELSNEIIKKIKKKK